MEFNFKSVHKAWKLIPNGIKAFRNPQPVFGFRNGRPFVHKHKSIQWDYEGASGDTLASAPLLFPLL